MRPCSCKVIHLGLIGGEKNVRRSAFPNLPRQGTGGAEVERDLLAGLPGVVAGDLLQAVRQTGGGKDDDGAGPRRARAPNKAGQQEAGEASKQGAGRNSHCKFSCLNSRRIVSRIHGRRGSAALPQKSNIFGDYFGIVKQLPGRSKQKLGTASVKEGRAGSPLPAVRQQWDVGSSAHARRRAAECPPYLPGLTHH